MKHIIVYLLLLTILFTGLFFVNVNSIEALVRVRGHFRSDTGTFVQPHFRSNPDNTILNNWSTRGNINPFTGQRGRRNLNR